MKHTRDDLFSRMSLMTFPMGPDLNNGCLTLEESIEIATESDIPYVDLLNVKKAHVERYTKALRETGTRVSCYIASISPFDGEELLRERIGAELETASHLSASLFMLVPYEGAKTFLTAQKLELAEVRERMAEYYRLAVELGKPYQVQVCLETTPHDILCLSGSEDLAELLQNVPGLRLVFDTANMLPHGEQVMEAYRRLKDYIIHVHLKDVRLVPTLSPYPELEHVPDGRSMQGVVLGKGTIPVRKLYETMLRDGYDGLFALEYVRPKETPCGKQEHLEQVRRFKHFLRTEERPHENRNQHLWAEGRTPGQLRGNALST